MIEIVADKDIPYLKEVFENSKTFRLKTLPFDEINKKTLKNSQALLSRSATILNDELINGTDIKFIFSLTSGEDHIDRDFLSSREIFIKTAKGANAQAVLEYTLDALSFSSESNSLTIFAGFPATTTFAGTSFITTVLALTIEFCPIVTPLLTIAPSPIQTLSSSTTSFDWPTGSARSYIPCQSESDMYALLANIQEFPILTFVAAETLTPGLNKQ